jgi:hypothetical protein
MKKVLFFIVLFSFGANLFAQKGVTSTKYVDLAKKYANLTEKESTGGVLPVPNLSKSGTVALGGSLNMLGMMLSGVKPLGYNPDVDAMAFVHRSLTGGSNATHDYSIDGGATWTVSTTNITPSFSTAYPKVRYPSGGIFSNAGVTKVVAVGPALIASSSSWGGTFHAAANLDASGAADELASVNGDNSDFHPYGLAISADNSAVWTLSTNYYASKPPYSISKFYIQKGAYSGGAFAWTYTELDPDILIDATNGAVATDYNIEASPVDPNILYAVVTMAGNTDPMIAGARPPIPHIWKTIDGGANWTAEPAFDFSTLNVVMDSLVAGGTTTVGKRPYFSQIDLTVDKNNNLHIFSQIESGWDANFSVVSGIVATNGQHTQHYIDIITDGTSYSAYYVSPVNCDDGPTPTGTLGYTVTRNSQISRTADGQKVFYTWNETVGTPGPDYLNTDPDILACGYDVDGFKTDIKSLSAGTDAELVSFYKQAAPVVRTVGMDYNYEIPMVYMVFGATADTDPCSYVYLGGTGFNDSEFSPVAVQNNKQNNISLYPNPSNGNFNIVNMNNADVKVFDIMGKLVYSTKSNSDNFAMNLSSLSEGTYVVKTVLDSQTASKQIVIIK